MMRKGLVASLLALQAVSCSPSGGGRVSVNEPTPAPVETPPAGGSLEDAKAAASGYSFLRPAAEDSYEVLYFDPGGKASLLRADQFQIVHGRWTAEMSPVGSSTTPIAAICLTLGTANRRCLDPSLLAAANTEKARGDVLGIGKWSTVPETLPRERGTLAELRQRIRS